MIIDLDGFAAKERVFWGELERVLDRLEENPRLELSMAEVERLHYLYRRVVSALARVASMPRGSELSVYLEALVARAHVELHDTRARLGRPRCLEWLLVTIPTTFRRHVGAFAVALLVTLVGGAFGAVALAVDDGAKDTLMPFAHLHGSPTDRVKEEEAGKNNQLAAHHSTFAAQLMVNNIQVGVRALAFGVFFGLGTIIILFYNGVILGAVALDYVRAGQSEFLLGWLLPHGSIEIPAIVIAGQAGLVLGRAITGFGDGMRLSDRLRRVAPDLVTLILAVALLLVWAGLVESFFSQYHQPVVPYWVKIAFGWSEFLLLCTWLGRSGASVSKPAEASSVG